MNLSTYPWIRFLVNLILILILLVPQSSSLAIFMDAFPQADQTNLTTSNMRINEVMIAPEAAGYEWIELKNDGNLPFNLAGRALTDEDGHWYGFPNDLPQVPPGAFVLVIFDGAGSSADEIDFGDNLITLHTPVDLIDVLNDLTDQVALYDNLYTHGSDDGFRLFLPMIRANQSTAPSQLSPQVAKQTEPLVLDFIAWGAAPGEEAIYAYTSEVWDLTSFISLELGTGFNKQESSASPGIPIGRVPGAEKNAPDAWGLYGPSEATPGAENLVPTILWHSPSTAAVLDGSTFGVGWSMVPGAEEYRFQLDDTDDFTSPYTDTFTTQSYFTSAQTIPSGNYFWRVKALTTNGESAWSHTIPIKSIVLPEQNLLAEGEPILISRKVLGVPYRLQHKDSRMLDTDSAYETGRARWDSAHEKDGDWVVGNSPPETADRLDEMYCGRAVTAMLAAYYGGNLSQDRISYELFGDQSSICTTCGLFEGPNSDLGHDVGTNHWSQGEVMEWAIREEMIVLEDEGWIFAEIKSWIDAGQPIVSSTNVDVPPEVLEKLNHQPEHIRVVDGYAEFEENGYATQYIHLLDPEIGPQWRLFDEADNNALYIGPAGPDGAPNVRSDEDVDGDGIPDTIDDSDGDGLCDFDERIRFFTDPTNPDSDQDGQPEKVDIREYEFDNDGDPVYLKPDKDGDGARKELDPDNDHPKNDCSFDGEEDKNKNGKYEPGAGETSNFNPGDDEKCQMMEIEAGYFNMGCDLDNQGENCAGDAMPLHLVNLDAYQIDYTEVTVGQYYQCQMAGGCTEPLNKESKTRPEYYPNYGNYPVIYVDWEQAAAYCTWAGKRLPTEAEWERAARGDADTRTFPWGNEWPATCRANFRPDDWCVGDTSAVGNYPESNSPFGIMDMAGNVNEWVADWYDSGYYSVSPIENPQGPASGDAKVVRGGSWNHQTSQIRVWYRGQAPTWSSNNAVGFRCAR